MLPHHRYSDPLLSAASIDDSGAATSADDSAPLSDSGEPVAERQWDESIDKPAAVVSSDDINALGLATDRQVHSYLGITSMNAVFRAIFRLCPAAKDHTAQYAKSWNDAGSIQSVLPSLSILGRDPALGVLREQRCIDSYFEHVHAFTPFIDENEFRALYASGARRDTSWMGLLTMVLVMGSISSGSDSLHEQYYRQARAFCSLDSLGAGNLESLQAFCLFAGYYLHYRNSPNMAYGLSGAAHRVAIALGLHREPRSNLSNTDLASIDRYRSRVEFRRRTWWGLFCLDTWACMTQARPTCGRWDGITMDTQLPSPFDADDQPGLILQESSRFCLIFDKIQHRFAQRGRVTTTEIMLFDAELQAWYGALPPILKQGDLSTSRFQVARDILKTRWYNARVILVRSMLLYLVQDCKKKPGELTMEQRDMMESGCRVACEAIDSTALNWIPNRIHVWNSAWYLFQACTVPLISMALERSMRRSSPPSDALASWQGSISKALELFGDMRPWMRPSDHSPDIILALYESLTAFVDGPVPTPSATDGSVDLFGWYDEQLNEMDWTVLLSEDLSHSEFPRT